MQQGHGFERRRPVSGSTLIRNSLLIGSAVLGAALVCLIAWGVYTSWGRSGGEAGLRSSRTWVASTAAPEPVQIVREVVVEQDAGYGVPEMPPAQPAASDAAYKAAGLPQPAEHLIIRNGRLSMEVKDTHAAQEAVEEMVSRMAGEGAYVVSSEEHGGGGEGSPYIVMSIRVPAARFDEVMDRLADLAVRVTDRNESSQDVTEEYVDLAARLESLEAARQRLLEIMQETRTTKDLLEAEQQLTQREAEIESLKGRMQYLAQSAQLASIWIELQPYILSQPVGDRWRPAEAARGAVETLVDGLRGFADFVIFFAIAILPWLLLLGLAFYLVVRLVRWRVRVNRDTQTATGEGSDSPPK